jgi:predicted outer membrane repeat protein
MKRLALGILCLSLTAVCRARTITVDDDGPADFNTIQAAIDDANNGDTVIVTVGIYTGQGNRDLDFHGKAITVQCTDPNDPSIVAATIIDCNGTEADPHRAFYFHSGEDACSVLEGFTITKGYSADHGGGALVLESASPTIANCAFIGNSADLQAGALYCHSYSSPILTGCTFSENSAPRSGGAISSRQSSPTLINCVLSNNHALGGGAMHNMDSSPTLTNCTFARNQATYGNALACESPHNTYPSNVQLTNCILWPGCDPGEEPAPNGNRINMGAYGGTAEASKSPANWALLADLTNDRKVDFDDLKAFTNYWPESGQCLPSDLNRDELVNLTDFAIFAQQFPDKMIAEPGMTYQIGDCDLGAQDANSGEPNFSVWVEGRYIHFEDMIYANCCPNELGLEKEIDGNQITLHEIGYGHGCHCMCYFPVTATLGPFDEGTYTVEVFDNYGQSLGVVVVVIGGPGETGMAYHIAACDPAASGSLAAVQSEQTRFTVTVEGAYVHFEDMMVANCCPDKLELEMTVDDNLITIREIETTTSPCRCICEFPVTATLGPFEPGTYTLEVYQDYGGFIGSTIVVIGPP